MNRTVTVLILLTCGLAWATAQDATTLQVAPSDQIKYPDATQILNKTEPAPPAATATANPAATPAAATGLPTAKPLVASTPIPAQAPAKAPSAPALLPPEHGWFLKWTITGDETSALGWVQALGLPASLHPVSGDQWEVWAGPLDAPALGGALTGQGGVATLVKR